MLAGRDAGYSARLAVCLRNQSTLWMDAGEPVAALEAMDECIGLCRDALSQFGLTQTSRCGVSLLTSLHSLRPPLPWPSSSTTA
jgi:hypothetical protein